VTQSDRQFLSPVLAYGGEYVFNRTGERPVDLDDFANCAARLFVLERNGYLNIAKTVLDYTRPGRCYTHIQVRLTPDGRRALKMP
jgi:hypothetical protein